MRNYRSSKRFAPLGNGFCFLKFPEFICIDLWLANFITSKNEYFVIFVCLRFIHWFTHFNVLGIRMRCFDDASKAWRKLEKRSHMHSFLFFFMKMKMSAEASEKCAACLACLSVGLPKCTVFCCLTHCKRGVNNFCGIHENIRNSPAAATPPTLFRRTPSPPFPCIRNAWHQLFYSVTRFHCGRKSNGKSELHFSATWDKQVYTAKIRLKNFIFILK